MDKYSNALAAKTFVIKQKLLHEVLILEYYKKHLFHVCCVCLHRKSSIWQIQPRLSVQTKCQSHAKCKTFSILISYQVSKNKKVWFYFFKLAFIPSNPFWKGTEAQKQVFWCDCVCERLCVFGHTCTGLIAEGLFNFKLEWRDCRPWVLGEALPPCDHRKRPHPHCTPCIHC